MIFVEKTNDLEAGLRGPVGGTSSGTAALVTGGSQELDAGSPRDPSGLTSERTEAGARGGTGTPVSTRHRSQ